MMVGLVSGKVGKVERIMDADAMDSLKDQRFSGTLYVRWREGQVMYSTLKSEMELSPLEEIRGTDFDMDPMGGDGGGCDEGAEI
jgi:hypothetical protein